MSPPPPVGLAQAPSLAPAGPSRVQDACLDAALPPFEARSLGLGGVEFAHLDPATAAPLCRRALRQWPGVAWLTAALARVQHKAGDYREARRLYEQAARRDNTLAQSNLAWLYAHGQGVKQDYREAARRWERLAREQQDPRAQSNLGVLYYNGQGVEQDHNKAAHWYRQAAVQGFGLAQNNLGWLHVHGHGVEQDYFAARRLFRQAARQDNPGAQYALGWLYDNGLGVNADPREAARWYRRAAARDFAPAQASLAELHARGRGVPEDLDAAIRLYRAAAGQGNALAQTRLARLHMDGHGVERDLQRAVRLLELAAEQQFTEAQTALGALYQHGRGVDRDPDEAARWYRAAAAQGHTAAQIALGVLHETGKGVEQDYREAARLFTLAAEQQADPALRAEARAHLRRLDEAGHLAEPTLAASDYPFLPAEKYAHGELPAGATTHWQVSVPAGKLGVLTLINQARASNLDLWVYADPAMDRTLETGTEAASRTELLTLYNDTGRTRRVYLRIQNRGEQPTRYRLYSHAVDFGEQLGEGIAEAGVEYIATGFLMWALGVEEQDNPAEQLSAEDIARASGVMLSLVQQRNLSETGVDLLMNELSLELEKIFGMGFLFDALTNSAQNIFEEIYRYYR